MEILNNQIIGVKIIKRSMSNKEIFNFSDSKPFKVYLEVKEEFLSSNKRALYHKIKWFKRSHTPNKKRKRSISVMKFAYDVTSRHLIKYRCIQVDMF